METVCAFANEPDAGGGYLLLGIAPGKYPSIKRYEVAGVDQIDKMQLDISSQCNSIFSKPIRVEMQVEKLEGKHVLVVFCA